MQKPGIQEHCHCHDKLGSSQVFKTVCGQNMKEFSNIAQKILSNLAQKMWLQAKINSNPDRISEDPDDSSDVGNKGSDVSEGTIQSIRNRGRVYSHYFLVIIQLNSPFFLSEAEFNTMEYFALHLKIQCKIAFSTCLGNFLLFLLRFTLSQIDKWEKKTWKCAVFG